MISDKFTIRLHNEALVLEQIIRKKTISRAELALNTHLNKASVSSITKKLLDEQLVFETGIGDSSDVGGRKPILLTFNHQAGLVIALDLGPNYIEGVLSYLNGDIIHHIKNRQLTITKDNALSHTRDVIEQLQTKITTTPHGIIGATIAIHGSVLGQSIIYTPNYDLDQSIFIDSLATKLTFPLFLENEANLAALGDYTFASSKNDLISISIHAGIGAGIVENGELKIGHLGKAGEFGHTILIPDGLTCPCGNKGCLERYASQEALYSQVEKALGLVDVNSDTITQLIQEKNPSLLEIMTQFSHYLSIGINNLVTTFDPEVVIINSSVCAKNPQIITQIQAELTSRFSQGVLLKNSPLKNKATLLGGVANTTQHFLNITNLKFI